MLATKLCMADSNIDSKPSDSLDLCATRLPAIHTNVNLLYTSQDLSLTLESAMLWSMKKQTTMQWQTLAQQDRQTTYSATATLPGSQWLNVTQLNERIRDLLEDALPFVQVRGEISDLHKPSSGHLYFTLVDKQSRVRAVVWRSSRQRLRIVPRSGEAVQITGRIAAYPPRGEYQLIVEGMQTAGAGTERERFLQLFASLKAEGLFDTERKKALPFLPEYIGVVTSASGAAIHDIKRGLDTRFAGYYTLIAESARVQGQGAAAEIIQALQRLINDGRSQVIICGRGGGSAEDLAVFNNETVVRAIAASPIPVVSAVGHEVDWSLTDWVADARAATPFAAAEQVMPEKKELLAKLASLRQRLLQATLAMIQQQRHAVKLGQQRLVHPRRKIEFFRVRCDELTQKLIPAEQRFLRYRRQRLTELSSRLSAWARGPTMVILRQRLKHAQQGLERAMQQHLEHGRQKHKNLNARFNSVSPLAVLQRGYAIVYDQQGLLPRDTNALQTGEKLRVILAHGELEAVITQLKERP